jgi:putative redox protein
LPWTADDYGSPRLPSGRANESLFIPKETGMSISIRRDAGPEPHDLYDASLAACKALTVLIYARRKGIPVEDIEVVVDRDDSEERKGIYRLKSGLRLTGDLTEAQRDELLRVAGKCPVHKLMAEVKTEIETGWAD